MLRYLGKIAFFIVAVFLISIALTSSACSACSAGDNLNATVGMANPAAIYCVELGYQNKIITDSDGGQRGVCIFPDNSSCDDWAFFTGKCGQNYSYCKIHECNIETVSDGKNPYSPEYAVCILPNKTKMSVTKLMGLDKKISAGSIPLKVSEVDRGDTKPFTAELPTSFDWRDKDGYDWMTPVKNQGQCGSCWAFATIGGVEPKMNIVRNNSDFNVDLSEQDLVSCGVPKGFYPFDPDSGGCGGAVIPDALDYIKKTGITDEPCFSYTAKDDSCSDKCSIWNKRLWRVDDYEGIPTWKGRENMKRHLIERGPLVVVLCMNGYWDDDIYRCDEPPDSEHAVVLVGYNDDGEYWIAKNSWGVGWGPTFPRPHYSSDGYFKIGYGECRIEYWPPFYTNITHQAEELNLGDIQIIIGSKTGALNDTHYKDGSYITLSESCSFLSCDGLDGRMKFPIGALQNVTSIDLIAYHRARSEDGFSLYYFDENIGRWSSLGGVPDSTWYQMKYSICDSESECGNYLSSGEVLLKYYHPSCSWCLKDHVDIDWLYLEVNATALVDTTPPEVTITAPANGSVVNTSYVLMRGYATDDVGVVRVCSMHESQSSVIGFCGPDFNATANVSISWAVELEEGVNTMTWTAYDEANNSGSASVVVIAEIVDTTPPEVIIISPMNDSTVNTQDVTVEGFATDDVGIVRMCYLHDWIDGAIVDCEYPNVNDTTNISINWTVELKEGINIMMVLADDEAGNSGNASVTVIYEISNISAIFDTGKPANPYPSIFGTHNGTIMPNQTITVSKLYTYPCEGTGGHTEYVKIYNESGTLAEGHWNGYASDYHNISLAPSITLLKYHEYNYTIITGSYPQIIHEKEFNATGGKITCTEFIDANGKRYKDWIPAIRLFL